MQQEMLFFAEASLNLEATLKIPNWRSGRKFGQQFKSGGILPDPTIRSLANANVGADGLNNAITMLWYLIWADLATNPNSENSPLCRPTQDDPCPLPPLSKDYYPSDFEFWSLLPLGNCEKFTLNYVIEPPMFDFVDGFVHGTAKGLLHLEGISIFGANLDNIATMSGSVDFVSTTLEYDAETETYSGLQLVDFTLNDLKIESAMRPLICRLAVGLVLNVVRSVLNELLNDKVIDKSNEAITKTLFSIPKIPEIENFPVPDKTLIVGLTEASMSSVSATDNMQSSAALHASVSVRLLVNSNSTSTKASRKKEMLEEQDSGMKMKLEELVTEWASKSNKDSNRQFSWHYNNIISNTKESHAFRYDSSSKLIELKVQTK